jgi:hypothetical protein
MADYVRLEVAPFRQCANRLQDSHNASSDQGQGINTLWKATLTI